MEFIKPEEVIKNFGIMPGMTVADFGCGSGHYSIEAGKLLQGEGTVYAIDIQKNLLEATKSRAESEGLENVEIVWGDLDNKDGSRLADNSVDVAIISNVLFQADNKEGIATEVFRVLKNKGKVGVIDWQKGGGSMGPPDDQRVSKEDVTALFLQAGFKLDSEFYPATSHYGLMFIKQIS